MPPFSVPNTVLRGNSITNFHNHRIKSRNHLYSCTKTLLFFQYSQIFANHWTNTLRLETKYTAISFVSAQSLQACVGRVL